MERQKFLFPLQRTENRAEHAPSVATARTLSYRGVRSQLLAAGVRTNVGSAGTDGLQKAILGFGQPPAGGLSTFSFQLFTKAVRSASLMSFSAGKEPDPFAPQDSIK